MSNQIHQTAIIDESVKLGQNVEIGPYTVITGNVELADGVKVIAQAHISGNTKIGKNTTIFPFASVGTVSQDKKYAGEDVYLEIGENNIIREHVTINPGTIQDNGITKVGDNCLFMVGAHIAHDCIVGNGVILANNATLAGHVVVGDGAIIGGLSAVHQFVRIGKNAMVGGMSGIENDIIPYGNAFGERANLQGLNLIGLKRKDISREKIHALRNAYKNIFEQSGNLNEKANNAKSDFAEFDEVQEVIDFISSSKERSICQPKKA